MRHPSFPGGYLYPDLCVGLLDSDVPTNKIHFAKVLPNNHDTYLNAGTRLPVLRLDQWRNALVGDIQRIAGVKSDGSIRSTFRDPIDSTRASYYEGLVGGASGNPAFLLLNDEPVLLTVWTGGGAGFGTSIAAFVSDINEMMYNLDTNCSYQLTTFDLSGFAEVNP